MDTPLVYITQSKLCLVTMWLFTEASKHRGSTSKCEKYVALLNYWSGGTRMWPLFTHAHWRCFLFSVLANRLKWKVLDHEDGRRVGGTLPRRDWLKPRPHRGRDALATPTKSLQPGFQDPRGVNQPVSSGPLLYLSISTIRGCLVPFRSLPSPRSCWP